jgi:hypothetical protein
MHQRRRAPLLLTAGTVALLAVPAGAHADDGGREARGPHVVVSGLDGGSGSAVGPDGALYVPEPVSGEVSRIDPESGAATVVASCLPSAGPGGRRRRRHGRRVPRVDDVRPHLDGQRGRRGSAVTGIFRVEDEDTCEVVADIGAWTSRTRRPRISTSSCPPVCRTRWRRTGTASSSPTGTPTACCRSAWTARSARCCRSATSSRPGSTRWAARCTSRWPARFRTGRARQVLSFDVPSADPELVASGGR